MRCRWLAPLAAVALALPAGCGTVECTRQSDCGPGLYCNEVLACVPIPPDLGDDGPSGDGGGASADLKPPADLHAGGDLTASDDMTAGEDLSTGDDLAVAPDLTALPDLVPPAG